MDTLLHNLFYRSQKNKTRMDFMILLLFFFYSLLIFSLPKWQRASQDPRIDRLRWWHSMLGCTIDGTMGGVRASQACRSFLRHSWRWANPVCWRKQEGRHRVIRPHSTFGAIRLGRHQYDRNHWNQQQRSILVCFGSSDATKDGFYLDHPHPTL